MVSLFLEKLNKLIIIAKRVKLYKILDGIIC